jgi:ribosomal protein S18 acetylase RimI-like enzyme
MKVSKRIHKTHERAQQSQMNSYPFEENRDMETVIELLLTCKKAESIDRFLPFMLRLVLTPSSLLSSTSIDPATDVRIWKRNDGHLCGFALVDLSVWGLFYLVSPSEAGGALEQKILSWACNRASHISRGKSITLRSRRVREDNSKRISSLERHGFRRDNDREGLRMVRRLDAPLDKPLIPQGFKIRHLLGPDEIEAYVALVNAAIPGATSVETHQKWIETPEYIPELDLIAVAEDGTFAAFCQSYYDPLELARSTRREGWTDPIGTAPTYRKKGLARAIVLAALWRLKDKGIQDAVLGVAGSNEVAQKLYESIGYRAIYTMYDYVKVL